MAELTQEYVKRVREHWSSEAHFGPAAYQDSCRALCAICDLALAQIEKQEPYSISDGFGSSWSCRKGYPDVAPQCGLHVVRPGKVQCWCDNEESEHQVRAGEAALGQQTPAKDGETPSPARSETSPPPQEPRGDKLNVPAHDTPANGGDLDAYLNGSMWMMSCNPSPLCQIAADAIEGTYGADWAGYPTAIQAKKDHDRLRREERDLAAFRKRLEALVVPPPGSSS